MTVKQLIEELQKFPEDMPVAILNMIDWKSKDGPDDLKVKQTTWEHTNYPYDKPDFHYINIE
jgi:hypothetical protein